MVRLIFYAGTEWLGTNILSVSSDPADVVTVIVSRDKLIILTVPTGNMDLPACDAEAKRVAFQISCATNL
ncbi:hypothetical protein ACIQ69_16040 [Bacillus paramycoides]|uniref:hypothetical protein n=1 Tax=Bacillus paramycoides TaxID=2026194 RepID=UPI00381F0B13